MGRKHTHTHPHSATIFILHPLLSTFSSTFVRNIPTFDHSSTLKRRPQTSVTVVVVVVVSHIQRIGCQPEKTTLHGGQSRSWSAEQGKENKRKSLALLQTWCGSAPRRGPSANGYDAWRFGYCGPGRKILAAAAVDLVWVCAPPRTIRKWLRRLAIGSCGPARKILAAAACYFGQKWMKKWTIVCVCVCVFFPFILDFIRPVDPGSSVGAS